MNSPSYCCNPPKPKGMLIGLILMVFALSASPWIEGLHARLVSEHIKQVQIKAGKISGRSQGIENFEAGENYWRDELKWHWIDKEHDRLYGIANLSLADLLLRKARYYGLPIPIELEYFYKEGLKVEAALGGNLVDMTYAAEGLAYYYQLQKRFDDSEMLLKKKLASLENPYTYRGMEIVSQLSDQYVEQKRYTKAIRLWTETFSAWEKSGAPKFVNPWHVLQLASALHANGEYAKVVEVCDKELRTCNGQDSGTLLRPYLADALHKLGRNEEAIAQYSIDLKLERQRRGWAFSDGKYRLMEKPLPDTETGAASDLFALGEIYLEQKQYTKAEPLLKEALDIGKKKLAKRQPAWIRKSEIEWTRKVSTTLAKLYLSQGRNNEAVDVMSNAP